MMNINLEYYKAFYYVAKLGGITFAAEELCVTQPAVSQSIKQLEKTIGHNLFIRTSKGAKLTQEGEVLYSYIKRGYEEILLGEKKFKEMVNLEKGKIRIGASDMTLHFYLLPFLEEFHHKYPKIKVTVTNAPTPNTIDFLHENKIDFGVVSSPIIFKQNLTITKVKEIEDIFVAGSKFYNLKNKVLLYKQLEELPIICLEGNTSTKRYVDKFLKTNNVVLKPEFELATSDIIVQFALRNLGIGSVMSEFAKKYIEEGTLFELFFDRKIPKRHICIITSDKNSVSTAARELLNMMIPKSNT